MNNLNSTIQCILFNSLDEAHEEKITDILAKKMQPILDELLKTVNKNISDIGQATIKPIYHIDPEKNYSKIEYQLTLPKGLGVSKAASISSTLNSELRDVEKKANKIFQLPFFKKRWSILFTTQTVSGRGPWIIAIIKAEAKKPGPSLYNSKEEYKDETAFAFLKYLIDAFNINPSSISEYSHKAGRIAPSIAAEAKKLAKQIQDFKNHAQSELTKLADQHSDNDTIRSNYSSNRGW